MCFVSRGTASQNFTTLNIIQFYVVSLTILRANNWNFFHQWVKQMNILPLSGPRCWLWKCPKKTLSWWRSWCLSFFYSCWFISWCSTKQAHDSNWGNHIIMYFILTYVIYFVWHLCLVMHHPMSNMSVKPLILGLIPSGVDCLFSLLGFFCPVGGINAVPCPKGTYGPTPDGTSIESCLKCPPHHYCPRPGLPTPRFCGPVAQQPLSGQETCLCPTDGQIFQVNYMISGIKDYLKSFLKDFTACGGLWWSGPAFQIAMAFGLQLCTA